MNFFPIKVSTGGSSIVKLYCSYFHFILFFTGARWHFAINIKQLRISGYLCPTDLKEKWHKAFEDMAKWIKEVWGIFIFLIILCLVSKRL